MLGTGRAGLSGQCSPGEHSTGSGRGRAGPGTRRASALTFATHETHAATGELGGCRGSQVPSGTGNLHSAPVVVTSQDYRGSAQGFGCFPGLLGAQRLPA